LLAAPTPNASGCHVTLTSIDYMLKRWPAFTRFLDDGRISLSNNAAGRALGGIALGRRAW
jgi:transposase